jgi:FkbM family methyltransferase
LNNGLLAAPRDGYVAMRSRWHALLRWRHERRLAGRKLLRAFADAFPEASFIEIGANDGVDNDALRPFIVSRAWSGVMVEPVPHVFERLQRNCAGLERVVLVNAAIADHDGTVPLYQAVRVDGDEIVSRFDTAGSLSRDTTERTGAVFIPDERERRIVRFDVPCLSFESLCREYRIQDVDLVLIDTEGYDYEIVKQIDFATHHPRLLVYEHLLLSPAERKECKAHVESLGYETMEEQRDTWCLDTEPDDRLTRKYRRLRPGAPAESIHDR